MPTELEIEYPIRTIFEDLEEEFPNLYVNIPVEIDPLRPKVLLLTGISGSGKDTVLDFLLKSKDAYHVTTATSRKRRIESDEPECAYVWMRERRSDESEGEYFDALRKEYQLIESDFHYGNLYGLPLSSLSIKDSGVPVIRTDINGTITLTRILYDLGFQPVSVGVFPDSWVQVYDSILKRGGEDEYKAKKRLAEDFNNIELYVGNINFFLHNSRETDISGVSGLDISVGALRSLVGVLAQ